ncbi:MAG TPA: glycosyltransferase family 2 protein [Acidimicrobiales bacterium]|nr:glycosyltransferase family 2 protein [Acidimicrobiales bacterium]
MPEELIPPVVAVVVAHDPGPWFEECLLSLIAQDYPNLVALVVDAASAEPLAPRVAGVADSIYLQRLEVNPGFGPGANAVLGLVQGAAYYLICHDDVVLAPDALRRMVEESFRSNAGIVGPKLVDVREPDLILQFGLGVDRFGAPVRRVEHREFDQAQHDETREVFAIPGGATLVRADLLEMLGGFDPEITMFGEDVDLCWRAHIVGARVLVTPFAEVGHLEAASSRQRLLPAARALQWRHELRSVLKNYEHTHFVLRASELLLWSVLESLYFLVVGHRRRAREVISAWRWNLAKDQHLRARRREVHATRRVSDHKVSEYMSSRTSRISRFFRPGIAQLGERWSTNRDVLSRWQGELAERGGDVRQRYVTNTMWIAALILVIGGRSLFTTHLPLIGQYLPLPSTTALITHFLHGSTNAGTQALGPVTPALLLLGASGFVVFGAMGVLLKLGLLACIVAGGIGMVRLVRPFGPAIARAIGVLAYLYLPLAWNDIARGDIGGLVAYGATPYLLSRIMYASGQVPFVTHRTRVRSRETLTDILSLGILLTLTGAFEPTLLLLTPLMAVGLTLGSLVVSQRETRLRPLAVAFGATALALVALLPWSLTFFQTGVNFGALTGAVVDAVHAPALSSLVRLNLGPVGGGFLSLGLAAAATYVLIAGRSVRFAWGVRLWTLGLTSLALAWLGGQGWLGQGFGASRVLIAPFAVVVALLIGFGASTVIEDLRNTTFGLRHIATALFALVGIAGVVPVLGSTLNGRFNVPATGYDTMLSWITPRVTAGSNVHRSQLQSTGGASRVLWLGNPSALPLTSWQITPGLAFGITMGGLPIATSIWPSTHIGTANAIVREITGAENGSTVTLGTLLASQNIRYLIVPNYVAPELLGIQSVESAPAPQMLLDALSNQHDLHQLPSEGGLLVFENTVRLRKTTTPGGLPSWVHLVAVIVEILFWLLLARIGLRERRIRQTARRRARTKDRDGARENLEGEDRDGEASRIPSDEVMA